MGEREGPDMSADGDARGEAGGSELLRRVAHEELLAMAHRVRRGERSPLTPSSGSIVHLVYLRLERRIAQAGTDPVLARAMVYQEMRRIVIDAARQRLATPHLSEALPLEDFHAANDGEIEELLDIFMSLDDLASFNAEGSVCLQMIAFHGYTQVEAAAALGVSTDTIQRRVVDARAWLESRLHLRRDVRGTRKGEKRA